MLPHVSPKPPPRKGLTHLAAAPVTVIMFTLKNKNLTLMLFDVRVSPHCVEGTQVPLDVFSFLKNQLLKRNNLYKYYVLGF